MTHVYLVHCFTGEYLEMYHCIHQIKYVVLNESEAESLVKAENTSLKNRQDYEKAQLAWYESVPIGKELF